MREKCLIVAPHPDDETVGAAIWMDRHRDWDITLLHVTDGSPRNLADARAAGFSSRKAYAAARRRELHEALSIVGVNRSRLRVLPYVDQEAYLHLPELIARLTALIEAFRPSLVLSPSYEGGHPDHDSSALAIAFTRHRTPVPFRHREYPLYHAGSRGELITGRFLNDSDAPVEVFTLSGEERDKKQAMLAAFKTQQHIVREFGVSQECFRDAPAYDFSLPPHPGKLMYEYWNFGVTGDNWRRQAARVMPAPTPSPIRNGSAAG